MTTSTRGLLLRRVHVHGDAAAVVLDGAAPVLVERDDDAVAEPRHRLVDRVVHDLVDEMVKPALPRVADVHRGAAPHGLESLEHLDVLRLVAPVGRTRPHLRTLFDRELLDDLALDRLRLGRRRRRHGRRLRGRGPLLGGLLRDGLRPGRLLRNGLLGSRLLRRRLLRLRARLLRDRLLRLLVLSFRHGPLLLCHRHRRRHGDPPPLPARSARPRSRPRRPGG